MNTDTKACQPTTTNPAVDARRTVAIQGLIALLARAHVRQLAKSAEPANANVRPTAQAEQ